MAPDIYLHPDLRAAIGIHDYARLHYVTHPDGRTEVLSLSDWQKAVLIEAEPQTVCVLWSEANKPSRRKKQSRQITLFPESQ